MSLSLPRHLVETLDTYAKDSKRNRSQMAWTILEGALEPCRKRLAAKAAPSNVVHVDFTGKGAA